MISATSGGGRSARFSARKAYSQTFPAAVAIRALGVLSGVMAARLLGRAGRGELAVIVFVPMMLISLGEFEFSRSLIIESSQCDEIAPELLSTAFWTALALGCIEMCLLAIALPFLLPADKLGLLASARLFGLYLPATYVTVALTGIDQGRGLFGRFSFFQVIPGLLYAVAILVFIWPYGHLSPGAFAAGALLSVIFAAVLRAGQDWKSIVRVRPDVNLAARLLKRGFRFYVPTIAGLALLRADMFLLVRLAPAALIGAYAVAQAISMGQVGMMNPFVQVGFAAVAQQAEQEGALEALSRHFRLAEMGAIGMGILAMGATPWGIRFFFGADFLTATTATYFLIGAAACWVMGETLEQGLRAASHPQLGTICSSLGLATLLALGVPAYRHFGIGGLAATVFLAQGLSLIALIGFCVGLLHMRARSFWAFDAASCRELEAIALSLGRRMGFESSKR